MSQPSTAGVFLFRSALEPQPLAASVGAARGLLRAVSLPPQQLRQHGDVGSDARRPRG